MNARSTFSTTRFLVCFSVVSILLGGLASSLWQLRNLGPELVLDSHNLDFGEIARGENVVRTLLVRNSGRSDLVIEDIKVSCGCTEFALEKSTIAPRAGSRLTVGLTATSGKGKASLRMVIISNDPRRPVVPVSLTYSVSMDSPLAANQILFGRVLPDALPLRRRVFFHEDADRMARCPQAVLIPPFLGVNYPIEKQSNGFYIEATLRKDSPSGEILADFLIPDGDGMHRLSLLGHVCGRLIAYPAMANLKPGVQSQIAIRNRDESAEDWGGPPRVSYRLTGERIEALSVEVTKTTEREVVLSVTMDQKTFSNRGTRLLGTLVVALENKQVKERVAVPLVFRQVDS